MSYHARAVLCVQVYQLYSGIHLGEAYRGPYYTALAVHPQILFFTHFSAASKTVHALFCGLSEMNVTHHYDTVEDIFIFKGVFKNTVYVLTGDAGLSSEFIRLREEVHGVDVKDYVDLRD